MRCAVAGDRQCDETREGGAFEHDDVIRGVHDGMRIVERAGRANPELAIAEGAVERDRHVSIGVAAMA